MALLSTPLDGAPFYTARDEKYRHLTGQLRRRTELGENILSPSHLNFSFSNDSRRMIATVIRSSDDVAYRQSWLSITFRIVELIVRKHLANI